MFFYFCFGFSYFACILLFLWSALLFPLLSLFFFLSLVIIPANNKKTRLSPHIMHFYLSPPSFIYSCTTLFRRYFLSYLLFPLIFCRTHPFVTISFFFFSCFLFYAKISLKFHCSFLFFSFFVFLFCFPPKYRFGRSFKFH